MITLGGSPPARRYRRKVTEGAEAFFAEWDRRGPGAKRSVERARLLVRALDADTAGTPVLTVVGSKGKGTAATYASAALAAAGCRVVTVTSPALREERERIRVDGAAIPGADLAGLGVCVGAAAGSLPERGSGEGYLSPSGLFTVAGVLHARDVGADVIVLEAGMGGLSDEVSLFSPDVVAITEVFAEHIGVLGDSPAEIAADKAGVVTAATSAVVSLPQSPEVTEAIAATVAARTGGRVEPEVIGPSGLPAELLPAAHGRRNAEAGLAAARRLLEAAGRAPASSERLRQVLSSVRLPGRLSWHRLPGSIILVDSAIDRSGAAVALAEAYGRAGGVDHVVVGLPDHKDVPGIITALADLPVTYVRMPGHAHLRFTVPIPRHWTVIDDTELTRDRLAALGNRIVALGTVYFTGRLLNLVNADTERLFTV
jgi:dihydrofolate synthase / folylpolyglutamate synthase